MDTSCLSGVVHQTGVIEMMGQKTRAIEGRDQRCPVLVCMGIGGLRAGEVCSLRLCDVGITPSRVTLRVKGKANRLRTIAFEGKNAGPIRSWAAMRGTGRGEAPWLLARAGETRGLTVASLNYVVRRNAAAAGLTGVHAHCLRHSCASHALANGM
jgi:integrase